MIKHKSIEEEAEECRKAFVGRDYTIIGLPVYAWHVHHEVLVEFLDEPIENRIAYILECKPISERAIRLRWMRPVMAPVPNKVVKAWEAYYNAVDAYYVKARGAYRHEVFGAWLTPELHDKELPGCPWDGETIFT